ncbi:MAG TPA: AI-2E family transporter [Methanoregula sp.]|nr:AI-2E family transporter [Methanoregula sp.]
MNPLRAELYPSILLVVLTVIAFAVLWSVMDMVLLGASLAIVLMPLHHRISRRISPLASSVLVTAGVAAAFLGTAALALHLLVANEDVLSTIFTTIGAWLNNPATDPAIFGFPIPKPTLGHMLDIGNALFVNYEKTIMNDLPVIVFKAFVFFFSLSVLLLKGDRIKQRIMSHLPGPLHGYVTKMSDVTVDTLYVVYVVQIAIAVLTFFIALPVFWLLGYGNILFYSFLAAFTELIPVLGSSVAFIIIGAYAFSLGDARGVLILFILGYLVVSCLPEISLRPVLVGRRVKIHPILMFIGIIGGLFTMGLAGFVLGPVIVVLLITSYRIYIREKRDTQNPAGS